jgi:hypothetical protein
MGSIHVPISSDQAASEFLSQIPEEAKATLRRGYSVVAGMSDDKREALVLRSIECLEEGSVPEAHAALKNRDRPRPARGRSGARRSDAADLDIGNSISL